MLAFPLLHYFRNTIRSVRPTGETRAIHHSPERRSMKNAIQAETAMSPGPGVELPPPLPAALPARGSTRGAAMGTGTSERRAQRSPAAPTLNGHQGPSLTMTISGFASGRSSLDFAPPEAPERLFSPFHSTDHSSFVTAAELQRNPSPGRGCGNYGWANSTRKTDANTRLFQNETTADAPQTTVLLPR